MVKTSIIGNNSASLFDVLICILFFSANYIQQIPELAMATLVLKMLFVVLFCAEILLRRIELNPVLLLIALLAFSVFAATLFNDTIYLPLQRYYGIIGVSLLVMIRQESREGFYKSVLYAGEFLVLVNLLSMILFPEGIYVSEENKAPYWILGQKQDFVSVFVVVLLMSFLLWKNKNLRPNIVFVLSAMFFSLVFVLAIGLTICIIIPFFLLLAKKIFHIDFKFLFLFKLYLLLEGFIIIFAIISKQFSFIFIALSNINAANETAGSGAFTKADSLYTRVLMWYDAIMLILNHPFGNGIISEERFDKVMKTSSYHPHIHNTLLDITLTGGITALIAFVALNIYIANRLDKIHSRERDVFVYVLFAMNVLMLTECLYWPFTFAVYMFAYYYTLQKGDRSYIRKVRISNNDFVSFREGLVVILTKKSKKN